jgi:multisubunit Na+/H+ antiporter MnhF subunit
MSTAEYAVGTIAAVAFAAVLYRVVRSPEVQSTLTSIVTSALHVSL